MNSEWITAPNVKNTTELFRRKLGKIFMAWGLLDVTPKAGSVRQKFGKLDFVTWKNLGFHIRNGAVKSSVVPLPKNNPNW